MEYRNSWPTYVQEKKKPSKGVTETVVSTVDICVGGVVGAEVSKIEIAQAIAECNKKKKQKVLPLDIVMNKLIVLQRSTNLNLACTARKAACELAGIRKTLAFKCSLLKKQGLDTSIMTVENRKALSLFKMRWASLLEATK